MGIWWSQTNCGKGKSPVINRNVPQFMHWGGKCHEIYWRDYFCGCIPPCVCTPAGTQLGGCRHQGPSGSRQWPFFHLGCTWHENWDTADLWERQSEPVCTRSLLHLPAVPWDVGKARRRKRQRGGPVGLTATCALRASDNGGRLNCSSWAPAILGRALS